jgi:uncharacterized oligopeptide transporter (OPT) family protein
MKDQNKDAYVKIPKERISAFEPQTFILGMVLSVLSAIICMQIIAKVGVTPNTSIIGAIVAMVIARVPIQSFLKTKSDSNYCICGRIFSS